MFHKAIVSTVAMLRLLLATAVVTAFANICGDNSCDAQNFMQLQTTEADFFNPVKVTNFGVQMPAVLNPKSNCGERIYFPSTIEKHFQQHVLQLTNDKGELCGALKGVTEKWLAMNFQKIPPTAKSDIFSQICPDPMATKQVIEPLAGLLRDPRAFCVKEHVNLAVDWLVLADNKSFPSTTSSNSRRIFFDAGGSKFADALKFLVTKYEERGIEMDQIYVWEAEKRDASQYWAGTPEDVRAKWEPRLTWYNGVPVTADKGSMHNPVLRIHELCRMGDFCAFKLDIDFPEVENALAQQLLENHGHLKEFFFEDHVDNPLMFGYWGNKNKRTFEDSYALFAALREKGLRAHSWV